MRNILAVFQKEMRAYFVSPIAYVVFTVFLLISGYFFYSILRIFILQSMQSMQYASMYGMNMPAMNVNMQVIMPMFSNLGVIMLFILPMITMRLYSEEKKSGTLELLMTSPITEVETVLGKYLAALALYGLMVATSLIHVLILALNSNLDWGPVLLGYLGLLLLGGSFLSVGLLLSTLTENQIISAALTFGVFLLLWVISWASSFSGPIMGKVFDYISLMSHYSEFYKGVLDTKGLVFYASFIFLGIFLTLQSLESLKWRS
jgi:ABC-2 type transport system permease protein